MTTPRKGEIVQGARRGRSAPAGEDVLAQGNAALVRAGFFDATLVLRWRDIAGDEVARVAQPVKLQEEPSGAVLTLRCAPGSAVLLQHETRTLIGRINAYLGRGRVARLRFVTGQVRTEPGLPKHPAKPLPATTDSAELQGLSGAIDRLERRRKTFRRPH